MPRSRRTRPPASSAFSRASDPCRKLQRPLSISSRRAASERRPRILGRGCARASHSTNPSSEEGCLGVSAACRSARGRRGGDTAGARLGQQGSALTGAKNPTEFAFPNNPAFLPCSPEHLLRKSPRRARPASFHTAGTGLGQYCRRRARPPLPRPATCPPVPAFTRPAACPPAVPASPFPPSAQPSGCPPARPLTSPLQAFHTSLTRMCHLGRRRRHAHFAGILVPPLPGGRQDRGGGPTGRRTARRRVGRYGGRARGQDWGGKFP